MTCLFTTATDPLNLVAVNLVFNEVNDTFSSQSQSFILFEISGHKSYGFG